MSPEQIEEIARLRGLKLSPKQIARKLGIRPTVVNAILKQQMEELEKSRREGRLLAPLEKCLINSEAAKKLLDSQGHDGRLQSVDENEEIFDESGFALMVVTRFEKNRYIFASYLVDYYCLGIKKAVGPLKLDAHKYAALLKETYRHFEGMREISLSEAQGIIFGAVEYANSLGFAPHPDWALAKGHLGEVSVDLPIIEFGRGGKPFVCFQLSDDSEKIIAKLKETVGEGNFDYLGAEIEDDYDYTIIEKDGSTIIVVD